MQVGLELALEKKIEVLLIEDSIHDARLFAESLTNNYNEEFDIIHSSDVKSGIKSLSQKSFDIIVADLNLPDSRGIETFHKIKQASGNIPIIILSGMNDSNLTLESIRNGAQDYVYKGSYEGDFIYRVLRHAIEREKLFREIEERTIKLIKLNNELQELNHNKDRMYSIISHDLLSPINALNGYASLLKENYNDYSEEERKESVDVIDELVRNVTDLLKELLIWSGVNTGRIKYTPETLNLGSLLRKQVEYLKLTAAKKNIGLSEAINEMYIMADKMMIETVARNLISNAIKFTKSGGKISIKNFSADGMAIFIIEDSGIGMEQNELDKLFKKNENISKEGTNQEKGIGLGLLICKEFINRHNGTIEVQSKKNSGTSFIVSLPKKS
ncbi:MAG TPA: hybrid sensor histidine kinase/response regulator [Ignavibacteriaceae bacterium]|nr:hybrid sensor histidine kinase/response regulator [Ignavibacteriaceae bacterium]